jgi:hypothetical protein
MLTHPSGPTTAREHPADRLLQNDEVANFWPFVLAGVALDTSQLPRQSDQHFGRNDQADPVEGQAAVAAVSRQVHLALFYDAQLDIGAMD